MCCLDIVSKIVRLGSAHALRILVIRNDVVPVRELFIADFARNSADGSGLTDHVWDIAESTIPA